MKEVLEGRRDIHIQSQRGHDAAMFGSMMVEHGAKPVIEGLYSGQEPLQAVINLMVGH